MLVGVKVSITAECKTMGHKKKKVAHSAGVQIFDFSAIYVATRRRHRIPRPCFLTTSVVGAPIKVLRYDFLWPIVLNPAVICLSLREKCDTSFQIPRRPGGIP